MNALTETELEAGLAYLLALKASALNSDNYELDEKAQDACFAFMETVEGHGPISRPF